MLPAEIETKLIKLENLEMKLLSLKEISDKRDEIKASLYDYMEKYDVVSYTTPNGLVKFTRVAPSQDKVEVVIDFDVDKLREEDFETYKKYVVAKDKVTKGRRGYLKTTYPTQEKESDI